MLKLYAVSVASVLAAVLSASASGNDSSSPRQLTAQQAVSEHVVTLVSSAVVGKFEVRNADRGLSKRLKVRYDGSRIATITLRRGAESYHCCTTEACEKVEELKACTALKISCDADAVCTAK